MTTARTGTLDAAAAGLELRRASFPWQVSTVHALRHTWARTLDAAKGALFAVDDASGLAGLMRCGLNTWTSEQGRRRWLSWSGTTGDEVNAPMLAVDVWLGYRPVGAEWECVKRLSQG